MSASVISLQTDSVNLQSTYGAHAPLPNQDVQPAESSEFQIKPDGFALAFDSWFSKFINDPFILELPLTDIFFHQVLTLIHDFGRPVSKERDVHFYYLEVAKEFNKWRQGDSYAKDILIKLLSNFQSRMPTLVKGREQNSQHAIASKVEVVSLWIGVLKGSSYEQLLLTPREIKKLYIGKDEDTLGHPVLKKSNFTRSEYSNYQKLLAYNQLIWSSNCLSHFFDEFKDDQFFLEKIMYALKDLIPSGENENWNDYLENRLERELGFIPKQSSVIHEICRKQMQMLLFKYNRVIDLLSHQVLGTQKGFPLSLVGGFALLYINDHKSIAQENSHGLKKHAEEIRKYCIGSNESEGLLGLSKSLLDDYDSVYAFFLFLESTELEEFATRPQSRNFENEFLSCLAAFVAKQKDPTLKMSNAQEEVRVLKRYQDVARYPDFLRIRKDVFVPFLRFVKDITLSTQAVLQASLSRLERLGTNLEIPKEEKQKKRTKEGVRTPPISSARLTDRAAEENEASSSGQAHRSPQVRNPKVQAMIPPIVLSDQQILLNIETKLCAKLDLIKEPLHAFAKERVANAKIHLMNVDIHLYHLASSRMMTKKELFGLLSGLAFEMNLCIEQLLMAHVLHKNEAKDLESVSRYRMHDLKVLLTNCNGAIEKKWSSLIGKMDRMGTFITDMGLLSRKGLSPLQGLLFDLYQDLEDDRKEVSEDLTGSCKKIAGSFFKFCDYMTTIFDPSLDDAAIDSESDEWAMKESEITMSKDPIQSYPYQYLFHDVKTLLQGFRGVVHPFYIDNIITNSLSRLEQAMKLLQEKRPGRAFLDFSTIFLLNQVVAEQVLEVCHLFKKREIDHTLYDHNLEKMADDLKDFSFTEAERKFLQKGKEVRLATRYPMSMSIERGPLMSLLGQVLAVSEAYPSSDVMVDGANFVTARNKKVDYEVIAQQIASDSDLLEKVLRKILEGCHP